MLNGCWLFWGFFLMKENILLEQQQKYSGLTMKLFLARSSVIHCCAQKKEESNGKNANKKVSSCLQCLLQSTTVATLV